jgi:translocator protein
VADGAGDAWYRALEKPAGQPPDAVFGPVWTLLYLMMGVAVGRLIQWRAWHAVRLFCIQLLLNLSWSPVFFAWGQVEAGLAILVALWVVLFLTVREARRVGMFAFWLLVPYLAWVSYALYLNAGIVWLNR